MTPEQNELLTQIGPGTRMGNVMRRYWWAVGFTESVDKTPVPVRILGEDLILFRTLNGKFGLTDRYCAHRLASLEHGRVENDGIRCCYHGWVYDVNGRCIDQPGEPSGSNFKDKIKLKAYPTQEHGGIVWAYMGLGEPPPFPRYDFLVRDDGERTLNGYLR